MKVLILSNSGFIIYRFRKELVECLVGRNCEVYTSFPVDDPINQAESMMELKKIGCIFIDTKIDRRRMNPFKDIILLLKYLSILYRIKPEIVLSYTIKPNVYGGIACRFLNVKYIANITGAGTAFKDDKFLRKMLLELYRIALKKASCIFFQNKENMNLFISNKIVANKYRLIPGSGVNLSHFSLLSYPPEGEINFVFISRIMKEKGIELYLETAESIKSKYDDIHFHVCGYLEDNYNDMILNYNKKGLIKYHGVVNDVREILKISHCIIHPSYYPEGMSNVLLESAACGRPIITTDQSGCREIVDDGVNGYIVKKKNVNHLIKKVKKFLELDYDIKRLMGLQARKKVELGFERQIVVNGYLDEIYNNQNRD